MPRQRDRHPHPAMAQRRRGWARSLTLVVLPALIASAGYAAVFRLALPRATDAILMAWALAMTFVASRTMTTMLRGVAEYWTTKHASTSDDSEHQEYEA